MAATACIKILAPGLQTSVQDLGRFGHARFGVAHSGALDSFAMRTGNLLVGNPEHEACLETLLMGLRIEALSDVLIAVTGADLRPMVDKRLLKMWGSCILEKGQVLGFTQPASGCRAYIAVGGGIKVPSVLGSKSTNLPSGFGGFEGRMLQAEDILFAASPHDKRFEKGCTLTAGDIPFYPNRWNLRVMWGPQDNDFKRTARDTFITATYRASTDADRTGIRLDGLPLERKEDMPESILSEGVVSGSIQVPGDGKPIIILAETVTGGYRKIATVISADMPLLGQIKPGDEIAFRTVSLENARKALREMESKIQRLKKTSSGIR
jgi:biotin-dependent carboxylase-like uncharacterized protein